MAKSNYTLEKTSEFEKIIEQRTKYITNEINDNDKVLSLYEEYLYNLSIMLKSFDIDNSIILSSLLYILIMDGLLTGEKFKRDFSDEDELEASMGIKLLLSKGCCRNFASFYKNIYDYLGEYNKKFYCTESENKLKFINRERQANHIINLIKYHGYLYGYDAFNRLFFNFINSTQLKSNTEFYSRYLTYKPYCDYIFEDADEEDVKKNIELFKSSCNSPYIDRSTFLDFEELANQIIIDNVKDINEFEHQNRSLIKETKRLLLK